jgi:IS30 family transposase
MLLMQRLPQGKKSKPLAKEVSRFLLPYRNTINTITTDNGPEFADHLTITKKIGAKVYFADPYSSWQKGCIENTNKLIRQYIPKKSNFNDFTDGFIKKVQKKINLRPRKIEFFYSQG